MSICCPGEGYEVTHCCLYFAWPSCASRGLGTFGCCENAEKHFNTASSLFAYFFPFWCSHVSIFCIFMYGHYLNASQLVVWNHKFEVQSCEVPWSDWIWSRRFISFHLILNLLVPSVVCVRPCMALITAKVLCARSRNSSCRCQCVGLQSFSVYATTAHAARRRDWTRDLRLPSE